MRPSAPRSQHPTPGSRLRTPFRPPWRGSRHVSIRRRSVARVRHGIVILPQEDWPAAARRWRQAEEYGFDHAWTYDHLSWRSLADQRWHATIPTLTAAATVTSRIGLGLFVASPNFRHPVPFAKELATLDDIAGGRVLVGVGSGGTGFDAYVLGQQELTPRERHARFVEFVDALDVLLRFEQPGSGGISFSGDWYVAQNARMVGDADPPTSHAAAHRGQRPEDHPLRRDTRGWMGDDRRERRGSRAVVVGARRARSAIRRRVRGIRPRTTTSPAIVSIDIESGYSLDERRGVRGCRRAAQQSLGFTDVVAHWPRDRGDLRRQGVRPRRGGRNASPPALGRPLRDRTSSPWSRLRAKQPPTRIRPDR